MVVSANSGSKVPLSLHALLDGGGMSFSRQTSGASQRNDVPLESIYMHQFSRQASCTSAGTHQGTDDLDSAAAFSRQVSRASKCSEDTQRRTFTPYHSQSVPKSENLQANLRARPAGTQSATTLMLRNIPNKYTQNLLMKEIDASGFTGTYDFFYLPMDVHNRSNVGYAFINFADSADAKRFYQVFDEHRFQQIQSRKVSSVSYGHVQGLLANLKHFENRAVTHSQNDQYRPVVLQGGKRVDFEVAVAEASKRLVCKGRRAAAGCAVTKSEGDFGERHGAGQRKIRQAAPSSPVVDPSESMQGTRQGLQAALREVLIMQQGTYLQAAPVEPGLARYRALVPPLGSAPYAGVEMKVSAPPGLEQSALPCHDSPAYVQLPAWGIGKVSA
mmetsp:Transcript_44962/g.143395  ORF Transcript_44962/g.143395 Transcript_44962/m.143395 type:complete len:387 (+) Transcript_44962:76-1236(+)